MQKYKLILIQPNFFAEKISLLAKIVRFWPCFAISACKDLAFLLLIRNFAPAMTNNLLTPESSMPVYNFCAGPAALPREVMQATADACVEYGGTGLSLMEMSHRSAEFQSIISEAQSLVCELLGVPEGYSVLFLGGGASMEFCRVPYNLLERQAAYVNTGVWATKAAAEARHFGEVLEVASSADQQFSYIPRNYEIPLTADYLHLTSNNTIYGTQLHSDPVSPIPVVCDMSSDIFSRPIDVSRYALIYGGAQKNLSMAGLSFVIVRHDVLGRVSRPIPSMLDYRMHVEHQSVYNTPPVLPIFTALQTLRWIKAQGGVAEMQRRAEARAALLYAALDHSPLFRGTAQRESRSLMNITFTMAEGHEHQAEDFLRFAAERGLVGLRGHRYVGGFRASCYNAMPLSGVKALVECMQQFTSSTH